MRRTDITRLTAGLAAGLLTGSVLVACNSGEAVDDPTTSSAPAETTVPTSTEASSSPETTTPEETAEESSTSSSRSSTSSTPISTGDRTDRKSVKEVQEKFSSLAPDSLFDEFDSCTSTGLKGSYDCSGQDVGQFQFFDSSSKAASTTQLLTELRSSRVVEDTGRKVVGWSTLGTTAVITVVDNDEGLVLQQMVSSDQEDPETKIYELGLAERPAEGDDREDRDKDAARDDDNAASIDNA